ncbi:MAG: DUF3427 domain-containing protein [Eubacterium sp.]|nr:DUF3427 domain-containing protein [Eubacterium sp.]
MNSTTNLRDGLECAFIDSNYTSNLAYKPQFVSNNYKEGKKVISSIEEELLACDYFQISVAFITMGGITPLLQILQELERRGIKGEILTTNYLNFSEPRALKKLHELENITIRMYDVERAENGFHTKGYIFKKQEIYRVIIGSSNMTGRALTVNKEWNTKIVSTEQGEMAQDIVNEFKDLWNSEYSLEFEEFYEAYKERYKIIKHQRKIAGEGKIVSLEQYKLQPNAMQVGFIQNLRRIIANGEERALLISATGTGKTYASAFAMRELGFKRVLFLVHRNFLAEQTMKSYKKVFAGNVSMGVVGAGHHECDADYIFATVQTLGKDMYLKEFAEDAFDRLAMEEDDATEEKTPLDYIFSVEILNEGVDIVEINQVIMLRPTQSPIVFIQQLGRGLRKADGKEYVVILDFIGNYEHNFMIPIALSGDRTYNKDNIRRYVMEGGRVIPGVSTVHFDEISRKRIFESVDRANFSDLKLIRENYTNLKNKLGRIPALLDFDRYGEMDVLRIFDNHNLGSYYKFLVKYEKEYKIRLSDDEEKVIEFISKKLASGKRIQELQLFKKMLTYTKGSGLLESFADEVKQKYGKNISQNQMDNIINVMTNEFPAGSGKKTYAQCVFLEKKQDDYTVSTTFSKMLLNEEFRYVLEELVDFGISRYERDYRNNYAQTDLVLYQKYTYEDVCRLLNWETNEVPLNIGGYKFDKKTKTFPVFINYEKADDISDTTKYEDHFTSSKTLIAISKSGRSLKSDDVQNFLQAKERGIQVELFVRKNKDDKISKEFYYLGHMTTSGNAREFTMANTDKAAVEIEWILDEPVREDLYEYIVNG